METYHVSIKGFRLLNFPFWKYIYAFKPFVVMLIPNKLMYKYHMWKDKKNLI